MRVSFVSFFMVFVLSFALLAIATASGEEGCSCEGCGCKGGPGWRAPNGYCVSEAKLASTCGSPAGAPCTKEAVAQVCFVEPDGEANPEAETQAP
jgi:hypothetical protein